MRLQCTIRWTWKCAKRQSFFCVMPQNSRGYNTLIDCCANCFWSSKKEMDPPEAEQVNGDPPQKTVEKEESSEKTVTSASDSSKHPLETGWTFWFDKKSKDKSISYQGKV